MPLIGCLIRILQNMEECGKRAVAGSKEAKAEDSEIAEEDFHLKILKDICCELLSNMLPELSKVKIDTSLWIPVENHYSSSFSSLYLSSCYKLCQENHNIYINIPKNENQKHEQHDF